MKLTRLRLIGFKSFVEPTDFAIEPGLTGVVGPNGCGKSNLVEAVRWVMGEASYKAMRAAEMDDVIFSGNTERPSRNHAEVSVLVDNADRKAPASFNEFESLEVSRRIMREHGSTFRVNGREVRARDVAMLFADASTGSRSPALVHQGRIGEIIQARPDQRRRVLEEAAGISGLHARRHEAELRLKAAEQNLARVDDVIGQLAGQMAALKSQARQAVRYRNISSQVRRTEALLFHLRWIGARSEVDDTRRGKDDAVRVVAARTGEQAQASTRQAQAAASLPALRETEAKAAAALQRLIIARETLEREEARAKERIAELDRRIEQFAADLARERALVADAEAALGELDAGLAESGTDAPDLAALVSGVAGAQSVLTEAEAAAQAAEAAHRQAREAVDAAREPLAAAERTVQRLETEAKTIRKLFAVENKNLWPPVMDAVTVAESYEKALGAALGDDLDAPIGSSAPMHWAGAAAESTDPALPAGAVALSKHVKAPGELARRLAQIGVVNRNDGAKLAKLLKPGQRLVSREGDLWRWDGFAAAAHAPTGAARRLAERGRLQALESELAAARTDVEGKRAALESAEAALAATANAEGEAREHWRQAQRAADSAREAHTTAEREIGRNAAHVSALKEAWQRLAAAQTETQTARAEAEQALAALGAAGQIEQKLAAVNEVIARERATCAEIRGQAQAVAREAQLAEHRLAAIADERGAWSERRDNAAAQIATLGRRTDEANAERAELANAPQKFAAQRQGLIGEIETATLTRRTAADRLAEAESELGEADKAARAALVAVGEARAEAARGEERHEGARRRLADIEHEIHEA